MGPLTLHWTAWLLVLTAGINSCIGNLLLKKSRLVARGDEGLFDLLLSPWFIGGLLFYGINVILFAKALEKLPVSIAYPVLAGSGFAMLVLAAHWLFDEQMTVNHYIGLVAVVFGIFMLGRS